VEVGVFATGGLEPDLTLVFDLPPDIAVSRRNREADRMEERGEDYYTRVSTGFKFEAGMRPAKYRIIDATPDADTVQKGRAPRSKPTAQRARVERPRVVSLLWCRRLAGERCRRDACTTMK